MPAAGWAAKAGDPVLWTRPRRAPRRHQGRDHRAPAPAHLRARPAVGDLRRGGQGARQARHDAPHLRRRTRSPTRSPSRASPTGASAGTRSTPATGSCSRTPTRPADAAAAAALSAAGTYGPLLLVAEANVLPRPLQDYLLDVQPGYDDDPVRGVYNHGWIVGDEKAISVDVQSRIDALLEIQPVQPECLRSPHGRSRAARAPRAPTAVSPSTTSASSWARRPRTSRCSCATASAR